MDLIEGTFEDGTLRFVKGRKGNPRVGQAGFPCLESERTHPSMPTALIDNGRFPPIVRGAERAENSHAIARSYRRTRITSVLSSGRLEGKADRYDTYARVTSCGTVARIRACKQRNETKRDNARREERQRKSERERILNPQPACGCD